VKRRAGDALAALQSVQQMNGSNAETKSAERLVRAAFGSSVDPGLTFYSDSDHLQVLRFAPSATLSLSTGTQIMAGYERSVLQAPQANGLGRANGAEALYESRSVGLAQTFGFLTLSGHIGSATAEGQKLTPYRIATRVRAGDLFSVTAERSSEFFVISPRTVELGLTDDRNRLEIGWDPTLRSHVSANVVYQRVSDGNRRWELTLTPRRAFARTDWINLDLGVSTYHLATSRDLPNGYYDPRWYESYEGVAYPYLKLSENVGLGLAVQAGAQREHSSRFRPGGSAAAELTLGIYRAWILKVNASATHNQRLASGAFQGYSGSVVLTKRFDPIHD
jgi:hypothetical protein